jgi:hypothetical protein
MQTILEWFNTYYPEWKTWGEDPRDNKIGGLPGHSRGKGAYILRDRHICAEEIKKLELKRLSKYKTVGLARLDLMWMTNVTVVSPKGCWIPCQSNDFGGICDHMAVCNRPSLDAYTINLLHLFPVAKQIDNAEKLLKLSLDTTGVTITRGPASFFRSCAGNSNRKCDWIPSLNMSGKPSGGQLLPWLGP